MDRPPEIDRLATAADVVAMAERLYGAPLTPGDGRRVIHPTAVWRRGDGALVTLKINDATPKSAHDFFVLNLCRARADAIVTSGKILREESDLRHDLQGPAKDALQAWRRDELGKTAPPVSLVLTSGRGLDLRHLLFRGATRPVVYTSHEGAERLAGADVEVVAAAAPSLRGALAELEERYGARVISIEAGPSSTAALYEPPPAVDELLLSVYEEREIPERVRGGAVLEPRRLAALFARPRPPYRTPAASGRWSFARYLRR